MIVAETNMTEIPERCSECDLFVYSASDYGYCAVSDGSYDCDEMQAAGRPFECPLKEVADNA